MKHRKKYVYYRKKMWSISISSLASILPFLFYSKKISSINVIIRAQYLQNLVARIEFVSENFFIH